MINRYSSAFVAFFAVAAFVSTTIAQAPVIRQRPVVVAYVPYWDQARGFADVVAHADVVTEVSPWWYAPTTAGNVVVQDARYTYIDRDAVRRLRDRGMRVIPVIANHRDGQWDNSVVSVILADRARTSRHIASIVALVERERYDGIEIDYEGLHTGDRGAFSEFIRELAAALHDVRKSLAVAVLPKNSDAGTNAHQYATDYAAIGNAADEVRIMAYDLHYDSSRPGPVAPLNWVSSVMLYAQSQIPPNRLVLGCPLYGYDWPASSGAAESAPSSDLLNRAKALGVSTRRDAISDSRYYRYVDVAGVRHDVWFEDAASLRAKRDLAQRLGLRGVALWRFGGIDPSLWSAFSDT